MNAIVLTDEEFQQLVVTDAKGEATDEARAWLRSPEQVGRWVDSLTDLIRDFIAQHAAMNEDEEMERVLFREGRLNRGAYDDGRMERANRKRRMARFRRGVETRLSEAKRLMRDNNLARSNNDDHKMKYLYREAIKRHRAASLAEDFEPTEFDIDLWGTLEMDASDVD